MKLLDQVLDHINTMAAKYPKGFDFKVLRGHEENLIRIFNQGDCGFLAEVTIDGQWAYLSWAPTELAYRIREAQR